MSELANNNSPLKRLHLLSLGAGALFAIISLIGFATNREEFISAYLFSYQFILGIALGSLALVMLHHMTGGDWGYCIRRITEASAITIPLLTILFIPIAMNTKLLYPWANPDVYAADKILKLQHDRWLNEKFWLIRACIYFAIWNIWAFLMWFGSGKHDRTGDPWLVVRMQRFSALGLLLYVVSMTAAAVDWIQSREAHWYSTILGLVICVSQALTGLVVAIAVLRAARHSSKPLYDYLTPPRLNDLGNLFLALTILWAYMSFAQLLIIWMGNISPDSPWYIRRGFSGDPNAHHGWKMIALLLILGHFFIPFFILLGRINKRRLEPLSMLAILMIIMRAIDCFWLSGPTSLDDRGKQVLTELTPRRSLDGSGDSARPVFCLAGGHVVDLEDPHAVGATEHSAFDEHGETHHAHAAA